MEHIEANRELVLKKSTKFYLGDNNFKLAEKWYFYTLEEGWEYVVFVVRRAYLMALIMERITGRKIETNSKAIFLTDGALYSRCQELTKFYIEHGSFPRILLCEDVLLHGRNINYFLETMENRILEILKSQNREVPVDEEEVRDKFSQAVKIHVLVKIDERLLLLNRYVMKTHICSTQSDTETHDFTNRISTLVSNSGLANASYIFSELITKEEFDRCQSYGFLTTIYKNITEYAHIETISVREEIKAVFTLRIIPNPLNNREYRVIPFVFIPNLGTEETEWLWEELKGRLRDNAVTNCEKFIRDLDSLEEISGKRTFNEWITLMMSQVILNDFNQRYNIHVRKTKEYSEQIRIIARNYNITNLDETENHLDQIVNAEYLNKQSLISLITSSMKEERKICRIGNVYSFSSANEIKYKIENYWYTTALNEEKEARQALKRPYYEAVDTSTRKVRGCGFTLAEIFDQCDEKSVKLGFAYLLQMMDAGIIGVSSYTSKYIMVVGFAQFVKAGEASLLIYPLRLKEYIPLLTRIQSFCSRMDLDWREQTKIYCKCVAYSHMDEETIKNISKFVDQLSDGLQTPKEWDINYDNDVEYVKKEMAPEEKESSQMNKRINSKMKSLKQVEYFEEYLNEIVFA